MEEVKNYEILKFRDIKSLRCFYSWRHIPNTKPITKEQREWLDEQVSYLNDFENMIINYKGERYENQFNL